MSMAREIAAVVVTVERTKPPKWFDKEIASGRLDESYWEIFKEHRLRLCAECFERFKHHKLIASGKVYHVGDEDDWEVCGHSFHCDRCMSSLPVCSECHAGRSMFARS